jgi:threonylcarbamoyladenosine tRNA methylthiotransferase MtaB
LESEGYRELVITGIEIASYGKDFRNGVGLADVVKAIARAAPGLRLRLGSLEPTIITREFCRRLAAAGKVCRHFHLSLQSGCDEILRRMGRKYDTARFFKATELLREYFPRCGLTADLIVGFPGETEEQHASTLEFIQKCGFSSMHIFPYSVRPGTKAAKMEGRLSRVVKTKRAAQAQAVADAMEIAFLESCIGDTLPVLFETEAEGICIGHADNYCQVSVPGRDLRGLVKNVKIEGLKDKILVGYTV